MAAGWSFLRHLNDCYLEFLVGFMVGIPFVGGENSIQPPEADYYLESLVVIRI